MRSKKAEVTIGKAIAKAKSSKAIDSELIEIDCLKKLNIMSDLPIPVKKLLLSPIVSKPKRDIADTKTVIVSFLTSNETAVVTLQTTSK